MCLALSELIPPHPLRDTSRDHVPHYVHVNGRWKQFPSLACARAYCDRVFKSNRIMLTIVDTKPKRGRKS